MTPNTNSCGFTSIEFKIGATAPVGERPTNSQTLSDTAPPELACAGN